jgi:hypothetical protein
MNSNFFLVPNKKVKETNQRIDLGKVEIISFYNKLSKIDLEHL